MSAMPWLEANQIYLSTEIARVRGLLEARIEGAPAPRMAPVAKDADGKPMALDTLCALFGLSAFERDVLLLCAGVELDARFGPLCATLASDGQRRQASFGIALAAFPDAHWSALAPAAALRHWRLVELSGGEPLTNAALKIDERILHYLAGVSYIDDRLQSLLQPVPSRDAESFARETAVSRLIGLWRGAVAGKRTAVQLCGSEHGLKIDIAAEAAARLGFSLFSMRAGDIPQAALERAAAARLVDRELALSGAALLIDGEDVTQADAQGRATAAFVGDIGGLVAVAAQDPLAPGQARITVEGPSFAERRALWREALGARTDDGDIDALASTFRLEPHEIRAAVVGLDDADAVWNACREQARGRTGDLARRVEPVATWDDLVLPEAQRNLLRDIALHVRHAVAVSEGWGFAAKSKRGLGLAALFAGSSGTGKTMAAEVIAGALKRDLYHIDLSQVVSKYIGETEKNLRRIFDSAERAGAILLFDEADALFGKRSEVRDSHDRYANIEVSYLLQRMEEYRGLAILTSNLKSALDAAFMRRLRFVVQFPFPDARGRAEIWRKVFPPQTPTEALDFEALARLNFAGGNIRNIALHAAFQAADAGTPVRMSHLKRAAESEYAKLEKAPSTSEMAGFA